MAHSCVCRSLIPILAYWLLAAAPVFAEENAAQKQAAFRVATSQLTVTGKVLLPDGTPAAGATITTAGNDVPSHVIRTELDGAFQLRNVFGHGARIHASSADGLHQVTLMVPANAARQRFSAPFTLTLTPATEHEITVQSEGHPVKDAHVAATGAIFKVYGKTDDNGRVLIHLPANARLRNIVAWHPQKGIAGVDLLDRVRPESQTALSLRAPAEYTVRVIDTDGKPVPGMALGTSIRTDDSGWISASDIVDSHIVTDSEGTARLSWIPRDKLKFADFKIIESGWQVEDIDRRALNQRTVIVYVRRAANTKPVVGRVIMPEGVSPEGILITGRAFSRGPIPYARARRDGTFILWVPADYVCTLGISDLDWASDLWAGVVFNGKTETSAKISLIATPAIPVTVRVTRGPDHAPVADAWVEAVSLAEVKWTDSDGNTSSSTSGVFVWLLTDANGMAQTSGRLGPNLARLSLVNWNPQQRFEVRANEPNLVEFHRPWLENRRVTGRLTADGIPYQPSQSLVAHAWVPRSGQPIKPVVDREGIYEVAFDDDSASLLFIDREKRRSAFVEINPADSTLDVPMQPMAAFRGTLLDEHDQPMPDRTLQLSVQGTHFEAASSQQTNSEGRFRFEAVPANLLVTLSLGRDGDFYQNRIKNGDRQFKPSEEVDDAVISPERTTSGEQVIQVPMSLADRASQTCRDARLAGLRGLAILLGDDSAQVAKLAAQVLRGEGSDILAYLPLRVEAASLQSETKMSTEYGWPKPSPDEAILVVLDDNQKPIATLPVKVEAATTAGPLVTKFLAQHRAPQRDATALLNDAKTKAAASARRVWIVASGSRCEPCYRLARWIDDQHQILGRDYVLIKLIDGIDAHGTQIIKSLGKGDQDGIPWQAIMEPDGKVIMTSSGPLGNIGMPASDEDLRHFRHMLDQTAKRITAEERDALIKSLQTKPR